MKHGESTTRRCLRLTGAALLAVFVAACGGAPGSSAPAASTAPPASSAPAAPTASPTVTLNSFDDICVVDAAPGIPPVPASPDPSARPYDSADAPAPVYFDSGQNFDEPTAELNGEMNSDYIYAQDGQLMASTDYDIPNSWNISDPAQAQLLACVNGNLISPSSSTPQAAPCQYFGGVSLPVYQETYTITLYILRTGKILTSKTITGSDANVCPSTVFTVNGTPDSTSTNHPLTTILTIKQITSVIGKYASA